MRYGKCSSSTLTPKDQRSKILSCGRDSAIDSLDWLSSRDSLGLCGIHIPGTLVVLSSHQTSCWSTVFGSVILIKCVGLHRNWIPASWPPPWQRLHPFLSRQSPFVYFVPVPGKKKNHVSPCNFPWNGLSYRMCSFFSLIFWQFIVSFTGSISAPTHTKLEPDLSHCLYSLSIECVPVSDSRGRKAPV